MLTYTGMGDSVVHCKTGGGDGTTTNAIYLHCKTWRKTSLPLPRPGQTTDWQQHP